MLDNWNGVVRPIESIAASIFRFTVTSGLGLHTALPVHPGWQTVGGFLSAHSWIVVLAPIGLPSRSALQSPDPYEMLPFLDIAWQISALPVVVAIGGSIGGAN